MSTSLLLLSRLTPSKTFSSFVLQEEMVSLLLRHFVSLKPFPAADRAVLDRILQLTETLALIRIENSTSVGRVHP